MCTDVVIQKEDVVASLLLECNAMSSVLFSDTNTVSWVGGTWRWEAWSSFSSNVGSSVRLSHITVDSNGPDLGVG